MKRKVYLEGELAHKYGKVLELDVNSFQEVFKLMDANFPDFKKYLIDCHESGVGFILDVGDSNIDNERDILFPVKEGDMVITAVPAGSKSGAGKILAAIAIIVATVFIVTTFGPGAGKGFADAFAALGAWGQAATLASLSMGIQLAISGVMQLMAPDPATDSAAPQAYLFNGSEQNIIEGDPVPLLYGELRVPGRPISFGIMNNTYAFNSGINNGAFNFAGSSNSGNSGTITKNGDIYTYYTEN